MAFVIVLDSMTPAERVALIPHDVFGYPFAAVVGRTPAACRQLASSALPGGAGVPVTRGLRSLRSQSAVGVIKLESVCADYCHARFSLRWIV